MNGDVWLAVGVCAFVVVTFLVSLFAPRPVRVTRGTDRKLDALTRRVDHVEELAKKASHDVANVRASIPALATKDTIRAVETKVAEVHGEVKTIVASSASTARAVERIQDFLFQAASEVVVGSKKRDD